MSAALGIVGRLSFDSLGTYLVGWHARPVMDAFIEAEKRAWEAEDNGGGNLYYGEDLAVVMHWRFLVGKEVPQEWQNMADGLHFINHMEEFILIERRDAVIYVLNGGTGAFLALKQRLNRILLLCAISGLGLAVVLAVVLSRRLTGPLSKLTMAVESRAAGYLQAEPQPVKTVPPIPLTNLDDEVGVLARAIAAREQALHRFVQRESNFTGDVSHELRTPLTVMQGGLEILEVQLQRLPQAENLAPVVQRLLRTTGRMSNTVHTLLMLARRPEEIEFHDLDCSALLWSLIGEMAGEGMLRLSEPVLSGHAEILATAHAPDQVADSGQPCAGGRGKGVGSGPIQRKAVILHTRIDAGVLTRGQKELAGIVFNNLLDNACQYTENGHVSVALCATELLVRNSGHIPSDLDIFARGVRGAQNAGYGAGLGLSLALRACERLGWQLDLVADTAGDDAVFRVQFAPLSQGVDI